MIRLKSLLLEWTGDDWRSCAQWNSHRDKFISGEAGATIKFNKSGTSYGLQYEGPASGISIAHAKRSSGDTLHQLFNVLICEFNPWLADTMYKPIISDIKTSCTKQGKKYVFTIDVPIVDQSSAPYTPWQLNHRGGWGHNPGANAVKNASPDDAEKPVLNIVSIPGYDDINTWFTTYPIWEGGAFAKPIPNTTTNID
jgi:hypothetical protein